MAKLTFYGGVGEIGGNKILLESEGKRIWLDFGMSFKQSNMYFAEFLQPKRYNGVLDFLETGLLPALPDMGGFYRQDYLSHTGMTVESNPAYDAIFLSHAHADHSSFIHFIRSDIPIYATDVTKRILASMEETSGSGGYSEFITFKEAFKTKVSSKPGAGVVRVGGKEANEAKVDRAFTSLASGGRVTLDKLVVEAIPVNHSIPGASGFLIYTPQGVVAYTGDIRFHGYDSQLSRNFIMRVAEAKPVALICEGTRLDETEGDSEQYVKEKVAEVVRKTKNLVIANYPWKDIERLRSFFEVARATGRKLALNLKQAYLLKQLEGTDTGAPLLNDKNIAIYVDRKNWGLITRPDFPGSVVARDYKTWEQEFINYPNRVTCDDIHRNQSDYIMRIDFFDLTDLVDIRPDEGSCYIRAVTEPFDEEGRIELERVANWLKHFGLYPYTQIHASGHASGPEINALVREISPKVLFPVHTEHPELFVLPKGTEIIIPEVGKEYQI